MSRKITEKILLYTLYSKNDPEAFAKLYDLYARRIYSFVFFKVSGKEEAEDITSEVFLKAWNYVTENKSVESFSGLLYRLARNSIIDLYRKKKQETISLDNEEREIEMGDSGVWAENLGIKLESQKIMTALQGLKQEYREIITLKYVDELNISEICEITGRGKIAARVTLHRGLKKLKQLLEERQNEHDSRSNKTTEGS